MRAVPVGAIVAVVLAASLLNLFLGALWVAALAGIGLLRRRTPHAAVLVMLGSIGAGVGLAHVDALGPPAPATYAVSDWTGLAERWSIPWRWARASRPAAPGARTAVVQARLEIRRREELRHTPAELTRWAAAAIEVSRTLAGLGDRAPAEIAAVQAAVAQLATTLTDPEFRDLGVRRERLLAYFTALEGRLRVARDAADLDALGQALDPSVMAPVSFGPIVRDLERVDAAMAALARGVTRAGVSVGATARLSYDEAHGQMALERSYVLTAESPLRIVGVTLGGLGGVMRGGAPTGTLTYGIGSAEPRDPVLRGEVMVPEGRGRLVLLDRRAWAVTPALVRSLLKPVAFRELSLAGELASTPNLLVRARLDLGQEPQVLLNLGPPALRLDAILLPSYAFHHASEPGEVRVREQGELWMPADPERAASGVVLELVPPTRLLRNPVFARLRPYLYQLNWATTLTITGLAGLTGALVWGRRHTDQWPPLSRG